MNAPVDSDAVVAEPSKGARAEAIDPPRPNPYDNSGGNTIASQPLKTVQIPSRRQGGEDIGDQGRATAMPRSDWSFRIGTTGPWWRPRMSPKSLAG